VAWATTFGAIGYFLAYSWETLEEWIGRSGLALLAAVAIIAVVAVLRRRRASA
jgi:membrane protein DedA with SNARE-associated domain